MAITFQPGPRSRLKLVHFRTSEKLEKKYKLQDAVDAARTIVRDLTKGHVQDVDASCLDSFDRQEPITLFELNVVTERILADCPVRQVRQAA